ncbi:MAG: class I SAM-dependent methyltransferase [Firmicutes bacterium]|nr:class I SAM-dependent methyltransferase [Bacillota bacterium]
MPISLSERLQTVYAMVRPGSTVADIGSDHGQLIAALCENGVISHGYASDNKVAPYKRLTNAILAAGINDKIVVDLADGVSRLPAFIDTVVLAGMGGDLIAHILQSQPRQLEKVKHIIVAANSHVPLVRLTLSRMGFRLVNEAIVFDKHYYEIISAERGAVVYDENDLEFGPFLRKEKSKVFQAKYAERLACIEHLLTAKLSVKRHAELTKEKERILAL